MENTETRESLMETKDYGTENYDINIMKTKKHCSSIVLIKKIIVSIILVQHDF